MLEDIKTGMAGRAERLVTDANTAAAAGTGALGVFATPAMVSMMEEAAFLLLKREPIGLDSVGTGLNIHHTRACLPGTKVWATATVKSINGREILFEVTAFDDKGEIGHGEHTRFTIDAERFMNKLKASR